MVIFAAFMIASLSVIPVYNIIKSILMVV